MCYVITTTLGQKLCPRGAELLHITWGLTKTKFVKITPKCKQVVIPFSVLKCYCKIKHMIHWSASCFEKPSYGKNLLYAFETFFYFEIVENV